jgi:hypothetical protein
MRVGCRNECSAVCLGEGATNTDEILILKTDDERYQRGTETKRRGKEESKNCL